jgi:hypothetical protein
VHRKGVEIAIKSKIKTTRAWGRSFPKNAGGHGQSGVRSVGSTGLPERITIKIKITITIKTLPAFSG